MTLLILFDPPAVGKLTVGRALVEATANFTAPDPFFYPDQYLKIDAATKRPDQIARAIQHFLHRREFR